MKGRKMKRGALTVAVIILIIAFVTVYIGLAATIVTQNRVKGRLQASLDSSLEVISKEGTGGLSDQGDGFIGSIGKEDAIDLFCSKCFPLFFSGEGGMDFLYYDRSAAPSRNFTVFFDDSDPSQLRVTMTVYVPSGLYDSYESFFASEEQRSMFFGEGRGFDDASPKDDGTDARLGVPIFPDSGKTIKDAIKASGIASTKKR
jgi:hypothetical protein